VRDDEALLYDIIEMLVEIGEATRRVRRAGGASPGLLRPLGPVTSLIVGARSDNTARRQYRTPAHLVLSTEERARLDQVSKLPLLYPYWHQAASVEEAVGRGQQIGPVASLSLNAGGSPPAGKLHSLDRVRDGGAPLRGAARHPGRCPGGGSQRDLRTMPRMAG